MTPTVKSHYLGFPADNHIFEHIALVGRPSSPFFYGILGRALARLLVWVIGVFIWVGLRGG
eukprot:COSAG01_NODE_32284_length_583_cov_3.557851_1_plen_60_part_10